MKLKKQYPLPFINNFKKIIFHLFFSLFAYVFSSATIMKAIKNIFHYNEQSGIATLDPAFAKNQSIMWAVHQLYNTLVQTDDQP